MKRLLLLLALLAIAAPLSAQTTTFVIPPGTLMPPVVLFPASGVSGSGTVTAPQVLFPDGTAGAPSIAFASETTLGFRRSSAAVVTLQGSLTATASITANANVIGGGFVIAGAAKLLSAVAEGRFEITNNANTIGNVLKIDALPTVTVCGAGSPVVTAGSTPLSGSVTIGTTAVATCLITFNGTAYPSAAHCSGSVETTTAANARAMGYLASATTLTIVPSAAWADSSVVNWTCFSAK